MSVKFEGLDKVVANLNKEIAKRETKCQAGLVQAGLLIRAESQKLTPVVTGNLRNSAYVVSSKGAHAGQGGRVQDPGSHVNVMNRSKGECQTSASPMVIIGFSANYAIFVHENPRAGKTGGVSLKGAVYKPEVGSGRIVYSTVGQWKFLEVALKSNQRRILSLIAGKAKQ